MPSRMEDRACFFMLSCMAARAEVFMHYCIVDRAKVLVPSCIMDRARVCMPSCARVMNALHRLRGEERRFIILRAIALHRLRGGERMFILRRAEARHRQKGGETYSPAALLRVNANVYSPADDDSGLSELTATRPSRVYELPDLPNRTERSPADDESELTALTATSCSYVSAYDSNNAVGAVIHDRDVTVILSSKVLNAALGTTTSIVHGVKGTLSPGSIQTIISHRHRNRTTLTNVPSPDLPYWSRSYHCVFSFLTPTNSSRWSILLYEPYGAVDCFILACDSLSLTLSSSAPVPCPLEPHPHEICLLCVPASPTWGERFDRVGV